MVRWDSVGNDGIEDAVRDHSAWILSEGCGVDCAVVVHEFGLRT